MIRYNIILIVALVFVAQATAQLPTRSVWTYSGGQQPNLIAGLGDVNGDGHGDYIVSTSNYSAAIEVRSGRDGSKIYSLPQPTTSGFGVDAIINIGDVDLDLVEDFAMSASSLTLNGPANAGGIWVHSGATGALIYTVAGSTANSALGGSLGNIGDVDGDLIPDFGVRAGGLGVMSPRVVEVRSGSNGAFLYSVNPGAFSFGTPSAVGDVDGDGLSDWGFFNYSGTIAASYATVIYSGSTGAVLHTITLASGKALSDPAGLGDLDGDGFDDFAVGAPLSSPGGVSQAGRVVAYSGQTGLPIWAKLGTVPIGRLGRQLCPSIDQNGDGVLDVVAASLLAAPGTFVLPQVVEVLSGVDGSVIGSVTLITSFQPAGRLTTMGDADGDGFGEILAVTDWNQPSEVRVLSLVGARRYGGGLGGLQTLDLSWNPGPSGSAFLGQVVASGAPPFAAGLGSVTFAPGFSTIVGVPILLDTNPANLVGDGMFGYSVTGDIVVPFNLRAPAVVGTTFYMQFFSLVWPYASSNGLELRFTY